MAANKYSYKYKEPKLRAKPIIITAAAAVAVLGGVIGGIAIKTSQDNKIAGLRYEFNRAYDRSFDTLENFDPEQDFDKDGLKNAEELASNTSGSSGDTDGDGITDGNEQHYGTDPVSRDTDGDGINDGTEILAGLDPLNAASDGTPDSERKFSRTIGFEEGEITLVGDATIYEATAERLSLYSVASNAGAISFPYEIYSASPFDKAVISFRYNKGLIQTAGITSDKIHIYCFNPHTKSFSEAGGTVDEKNGIVKGEVSGNGVYLIGADAYIQTAAIAEDTPVNIHMLIDNSGSMYPSIPTYKSEENDTNFKRISFASNFITKTGLQSNIAISTFTYSFETLCDYTKDKSHSMNAVNSIRSIGAGYDGTSVERALMLALESFPKETITERNIIVILTDGISTDTAGYTLEQIVNTAQAKNVMIMTISLGDDIDRELLQSIADSTGGKYFPISEADALEGLYTTLIATMENDIVDEDEDGVVDSYSLFDTGFRAEENGFKFTNFKTKDASTVDFGMTMLARDWFLNRVRAAGGGDDKDLSYDFSNSDINIRQPLSKVILTSLASEYMKPENYLNFLSGGDILEADNQKEKEAQELGWTIKRENIPGGDSEWSYAEYLVPNYAIEKIREKYGENDYNMLRAIHLYNTLRDTGKSFPLTNEASLNLVKSTLGKGEPMLMKMTWEDSGNYYSRYVLLSALRRDLDNPNSFNLKIYDVNSDPENTVTLSRTLRLTEGNAAHSDYTYSAEWKGREVFVEFYLTEMEK